MTDDTHTGSSDGFEVLAFFTADHAVVENGKVYVNGGFFDRFYFPAFPASLSIAVVSLVRVPPEQFQRDHVFTVEMEGPGADKPPLKIEGGFRVTPSPDSEPGEASLLPLAVPLTGLSLERAGEYWFVLSIDGKEVARYRVRAAQVGVMAQLLPQTPTGDSVEQQEE